MFPFSILFPSLIWRRPATEKVIYLTFDDGPAPEITPWVISILKKYNAKATFFCIGSNVLKFPDIYNTVIEEGHSTGNHTFSHCNGWKVSNARYFEDIDKASELIQSCFFRPPYGKITPLQALRIRKKYEIIMWDVLSKDYDVNATGKECIERVKKKTKPGSIIVFHDSVKAEPRLKVALPEILEYFTGLGYHFEKL